jgi:Phage terminase-like protein, large subunit
MPKKNGKTTLLAALALYHLLMVPVAECVVGAASRDQAAILHRQACGLVKRSGLERRPVEGSNPHARAVYEGYFSLRHREIEFEEGRIRVLAADVSTADGVIPTLALVDELHRHPPGGELYGVFRDGLGPRDGQIITISTPGSTKESTLGELREKALEFARTVRGRRRVYRTKDFVLVEWGLLEGDNPEDMKTVKMANPAPHQTIAKLRKRRNSPSMKPWQWRRFGAGMWTSAEEPVIDEKVWDGLAVDLGGVTDGDEVYVATRITQQGGCGIGIAAPKEDGRIAVRIEQHPYDFPGLEFALRRIADRYDVRVIYGYAPQYGLGGVQVMNEGGLPLEDQPQSPRVLMEATSTFMTLVASGKLIHDGDPELRKQVMSAMVKEAPTGSYFVPSKEVQGLIAVILAADQASQPKPSPTIHVWQGA